VNLSSLLSLSSADVILTKNVYLDELLEPCTCKCCVIIRIRENSVDIATRILAGRLGFDSLQKQEFLLFSIASRPARWPTRSTIQWKRVALSPEVDRQGVKLTIHLHIVPEVKYAGAITPLPHTSSRRGA
jgi:hypothetical protein